MLNRDASLAELRSGKRFDIVIVGGGATGLGAAVDAASRGHRVALVEQSDFAKGTSSRSTKLVHGGVRYLRQGNVSLVLEALRERGRLYRNAPHLVHNMAFVIPNYRWWEGPFYGIGMKVYDRMAGRLGLSPSRTLSKEETMAMLPTVERDNLVGGVIYHDGQFDDARLAVNLARTAANHGAFPVNYVRCDGLLKEGGEISGIHAMDTESGESFEVCAGCVINATGVFADALRRRDDPEAAGLLAVSQGVHLVLPKDFLPGNAAVMIPRTADGRVLFAVPWHGRVIVGTTDTPLADARIEPRALESECAFLLEEASRYLTRDPRPGDVLSVFAGLRPLVRSGHGEKTAALSRDHTIVISESGMVTIVGGKWTTYRKMAEDVVDHAEVVADLENVPCRTVDLPIHGSSGPVVDSRLGFYGSDARSIEALIDADPSLGAAVHSGIELSRAEVVWQAREEMARTVEDVLARRTRWLLLHAARSIDAAPAVARILAAELGKSRDWVENQIAAYTELARGYVYTDPKSRSVRSVPDG
ncbi:MAG: glycerol-3-phosphate dehydrogenase/oxidase [Opitutaceae bacterium]